MELRNQRDFPSELVKIPSSPEPVSNFHFRYNSFNKKWAPEMNLLVMTNTFCKVQDILIPWPEFVLNRGIRVFDVKGEMFWGQSLELISLIWTLMRPLASSMPIQRFPPNFVGDHSDTYHKQNKEKTKWLFVCLIFSLELHGIITEQIVPFLPEF